MEVMAAHFIPYFHECDSVKREMSVEKPNTEPRHPNENNTGVSPFSSDNGLAPFMAS